MTEFITGHHPTKGTLFAAVSVHTWMPYYGVLNASRALAGLAPFACRRAAEEALRAAGATLAVDRGR